MTPTIDDGDVRIYQGDVLEVLRRMPDASVDCCVTSPPYYGLRDYGVDGQIGLEDTPEAFIERLVAVFAEVRRVLAPHGTCWVNMGDSYNAYNANRGPSAGFSDGRNGRGHPTADRGLTVPSAKPKDLLMMPARLALALQDDGWWLRSDIIWAKPNPMPESVRDRPTSAHEHVFLLTKAPRYYWDAEGVREPNEPSAANVRRAAHGYEKVAGTKNAAVRAAGGNGQNPESSTPYGVGGRNVRTVWTFPTEPNPEAHFATFPRELVRRCLAAGCPERVCGECGAPSVRVVESEGPTARDRLAERGAAAYHQAQPNGNGQGLDYAGGHGSNIRSRTTLGWTDCGHGAYRPGVVLDPFVGSGTTALVARRMGLRSVGIELNPAYVEIAARRLQQLSLLGGAA